MKKSRHYLASLFLVGMLFFAAGSYRCFAGEREPVTLLVAAAASLQYSYADELIPLFTERYPWITVEGTYDSSGKLQTQIENGLAADVFTSAATKQMDALVAGGFVDASTVRPLLENRIVLISATGDRPVVTRFQDVLAAPVIAIGDPASVPAGQYAREIFQALGIWDAALEKASLGSNVTEVLNWVAEKSAPIGVVYATDAATTDRVTVVAQAPENALRQPVIYPVGILAGTDHPDEARLFREFLRSPEAMAVFVRYGFAPAGE